MRHARILMDIEVQRDFFQPGGSMYSRQANTAAGNIYRLFDWARGTGTPVISTVLLVRPAEHGPFGRIPHCVEGSGGERKLSRTLLPRRVNLGLGHNTDVPFDVLERYQQVIFEKRDTDIFRHARAERLLTDMPSGTMFILCGAGVALGLRQAVIGLRSRGFAVTVAEDAVLDLGDPLAEMAWLQMVAKSARPLPTEQIVGEPVSARRLRRPADKAHNAMSSR